MQTLFTLKIRLMWFYRLFTWKRFDSKTAIQFIVQINFFYCNSTHGKNAILLKLEVRNKFSWYVVIKYVLYPVLVVAFS